MSSRKYSDRVRERIWPNCPVGHYSYKRLRRGLKQVHIGDDVWLIGKESNNAFELASKKSRLHQVIYGPNRKEYHVWDEDVVKLRSEIKDEYGELVLGRNGNYADHAKVKVYILTSILDKKENWCFDLKKIPPVGKLKVIYENGTVKNIDFEGKFVDAVIGRYKSVKKPVAYRLVSNIS